MGGLFQYAVLLLSSQSVLAGVSPLFIYSVASAVLTERVPA